MNGIIIDGKIYEAVRCDSAIQCKTCCFNREFGCDCHPCEIMPCRLFDYIYNFRYSQSLTDKLNK